MKQSNHTLSFNYFRFSRLTLSDDAFSDVSSSVTDTCAAGAPFKYCAMMIDQEKLESHWHLLATEGPKTVGVTSEFNPLKCPPSWYDAERFRNAQLLAKKYYLSLNIAHFIGNILLVHLPDVLIPVLASGHSASPYMVFMRILSTVVHILSWYEEDPVSSLLLPLLQVVDSCYLKLPFSV